MVAGCFIKAGDKVRAARTGRARAYAKSAGQFGLPGSGERRSLLMPDADPLYRAAANRVAQRVERVTDQAEYLPNADLFQHADEDVRYHLSHVSLLRRYEILVDVVRWFGMNHQIREAARLAPSSFKVCGSARPKRRRPISAIDDSSYAASGNLILVKYRKPMVALGQGRHRSCATRDCLWVNLPCLLGQHGRLARWPIRNMSGRIYLDSSSDITRYVDGLQM